MAISEITEDDGSTRSGSDSVDLSAVIFDWDGTLIDSQQALQAALAISTSELIGEALPLSPSDRALMMDLGEVHSLRLVSEDAGMLDRLHRRFRDCYRDHRPIPQLRDGAEATLRLLRERGIVCAVLTAGDEHRVREEMEWFGLAPLIDHLVTGEDLPATLPSTVPIQILLDRLDLPPERVTFVGDTINDVIGGEAAGVRVVLVGTDFQFAYDDPGVPAQIIHSLRSLPTVLLGDDGNGGV